jgi:hypothetical protein
MEKTQRFSDLGFVYDLWLEQEVPQSFDPNIARDELNVEIYENNVSIYNRTRPLQDLANTNTGYFKFLYHLARTKCVFMCFGIAFNTNLNLLDIEIENNNIKYYTAIYEHLFPQFIRYDDWLDLHSQGYDIKFVPLNWNPSGGNFVTFLLTNDGFQYQDHNETETSSLRPIEKYKIRMFGFYNNTPVKKHMREYF